MTILMVYRYNVYMVLRPQLAWRILPLVLPLIAALLFIIASLNSFFIQDDWYHLYQIVDRSAGDVAKTFILWQPTTDPLQFYRPLSTKLFFFVMHRLFGLKHLAYLGVNALLFAINSWLLYRITRFFVSPKLAIWTLFLYSFSLVHFTLFAYHTKAEDLLFALFTLLTIWLVLKKKPFTGSASFILALMSRESALVIPVFIGGLLWFWPKKRTRETKQSLIFTSLLALGYTALRSFVYGWPLDKDVYVIQFGPHIFTNLFKYLQWNVNLTGLAGESTLLGWVTRFCLILFLSLLIWSGITSLRLKSSRRLLGWGSFWWLLFLGPVLFFPQHRDPWNLVVAGGGLALILAKTLTKNRLTTILATGSYLLLFSTGLSFYHSQHWVMARSELVRTTQALVANQCRQEKIIFPVELKANDQELQYAWYYDLGPKVLCHNPNLEVVYPHDQ